MSWPNTAEDLAREQDRLGRAAVDPWDPGAGAQRVGACAVVFGRGGGDGTGWAAAVVFEAGERVAVSSAVSRVGSPFRSGLLALREGPPLEAAVRALSVLPDVLLVAAAGRDHPRGAGLALQLGAILGVPTVGVTDGPLVASGGGPAPSRGSLSALVREGEVVAFRVRTRTGAEPVVAHAAFRTSPEVAARLVLSTASQARWPEPLREARRLARQLRAGHSPGR